MKDEAVALCLLRAGCADGLSTTTFKEDIKVLLAFRMGPGELRAVEQESRDLLAARGLVVKPPRARTKFILSNLGRQEAARILGLKAWPTKDPSWAKLVLSALAGRALGLSAMDFGKLTKVESLRREILRRLCGIEPAEGRLSRDNVQKASEAVEATGNDKPELQRRLFSRGAAGLKIAPPAEDISGFAREVLRLARELRTGRVGRDLVFVNHVWKAYAKAHPESDLDLVTFKERLREAWKARKMPLAIANVLEPKWFGDVAESRIDDGRQEWHVIDLAAA